MQKINIHNIIGKLETSNNWKKYKVAVLRFLCVSYDNDILKKYVEGGREKVEKYNPILITKIKSKKYFLKKEPSLKKELVYYIGEEGISNLELPSVAIKNYPKEWTWNKFELLKKEFLELVFEEINYCPNCGKVPFLKVENSEKYVKGFDLDHFFPKSKYNYLMFNFYNLIPICPFCNQKIKKDRNPLDYEGNIFNPYFGILKIKNKKIKFTNSFEVDNCFKFSEIGSAISYHQFDEGYSDFLNLKDIYIGTKDTNNVFKFIQDKEYKIKDEKTRCPSKIKSDDDWKEYFFNGYYSKDKDKTLKFANGKLKKDLIENLKI